VADQDAQDALTRLSRWIDEGNAHRNAEAITWGRLAKLSEEVGEVIAAFIGATGQNPRKGVTHDRDDVRAELLDVAVTALAAYEHLDHHQHTALERLEDKIRAVAIRAGVVTKPARPGSRHRVRIEVPSTERDRIWPSVDLHFTCSSEPDAPCRSYPDCDCSFDLWFEHDTKPGYATCGHKLISGQNCTVRPYFEDDSAVYVGPDAIDDAPPATDRDGWIDTAFDGESLTWQFADPWAGAKA